MRIKKKFEPVKEADMTPMIDMTFQLIAFFMVIINFTETEQNQAIQLPKSELAKPPEDQMLFPLTLQITRPEGADRKTYVYYGTRKFLASPPDLLKEALNNQKTFLEAKGKTTADATVIIRADSWARTGDVQRIIELCQDVGYENFALRALQEKEHL